MIAEVLYSDCDTAACSLIVCVNARVIKGVKVCLSACFCVTTPVN